MSRPNFTFYLALGLMVAFPVWMVSYSLILLVVWKDGRILHLMTTADPLAPIEQFAVYWGNRPLQLTAAGSLLPAILSVATVVAFGTYRPSNPLGDAAFQDLSSLRRGGWFHKDGYIIGRRGWRTLRRMDDRHHLVIGPTRSGKGVGYVIPNALMHKGSMIVTDLKGEIFELTAGYRAIMGDSVFLFSPSSEKTHRWNPLDFVRADRGNRTIDIQNIASILIPETTGSENAIWQGIAQQVIAGVISYVLESIYYKHRRNLGEVNGLFNAGLDLQVLMKSIMEKETYLSRFTTESFNAYIALNERAARSALLDIQNALTPFRNDRVVAATCVTDIDLVSLQRRPVTIYLAPKITDMTILRPLLTLFVQQAMDLLTREHNPKALPVYFLLDEFRQLKKMDEIMNKLPYVAGYNVKMAFVVQDLKSVDEIYGETARHSLVANCGLQLIMGANDQETANYASRALGKRTVRYQSESRTVELFGLSRRTKVEQIRDRDLMMPQEIRQMPETQLIVFVEGQRPIVASKLRYHATEPFSGAVRYAVEHRQDIPPADFLTILPVPATTAAYGAALRQLAAPPGVERREDALDRTVTIEGSIPERVAKGIRKSPAIATTRATDVVGDPSVRTAEENLLATARRLKAVVTNSLAESPQISTRHRESIQDVLAQAIPDSDSFTLG
ncbi:type IV secretory system conjugative DNA transfer family protein [Rhizobium sp. A22-96]